MKVLVIEDNEIIGDNICTYLKANNYTPYLARDGEIGLEMFYSINPDLVVLDLMLPKMMGEEVCIKIRESSNVAIIMLTAKVQEDDKVNGLDIGADDYITKPFSMRVFISRVNSICRRINNFSDDNYVSYNNGDLKINYLDFTVLKNNKKCDLTQTEREILFTLSKNFKKTFSREELLSIVFGSDFDGFDRAVDTHIKNLRKKIETDTSSPQYIITVRGIGYKFGGGV